MRGLLLFIAAGAILSGTQSAYGYDFSCWNDSYCGGTQCHGDADCSGSVTFADRTIFLNAYNNGPYDPRADFDRNFRVDEADGEILEAWLMQPVPRDCGKKVTLDGMSECLLGGSSYVIQWKWRIYTDYVPMPGDADHPGTFQLYYCVGPLMPMRDSNWILEDSNCILIDTVSHVCSYMWQVPVIDSNECHVLLGDVDHPGLRDVSNAFAIHRCTGVLNGDANGDCYVDFRDLAIVVGSLGSGDCSEANGWCNGADLDRSGGVDMRDCGRLCAGWLECANPCDSRCAE